MVMNYDNSLGIVVVRLLALMVGALLNGCYCPINSILYLFGFALAGLSLGTTGTSGLVTHQVRTGSQAERWLATHFGALPSVEDRYDFHFATATALA